MTRTRLLARASLGWQRAHSSLWFIPAILVVFAIALSTALLEFDTRLADGYAGTWWLFGGSATGGRTILSAIAGSLITVAAVAFSVTMLAIQQASTQFTPRILRTFTRDRGNQIVLGAYIATFTYALLVLRKIRSAEDGDLFVPSIAISTGILLALISLGLLIYFIHHVSEALQVGALLSHVRRDLDREIEDMFPEQLPAAGSGSEDHAEAIGEFERECVGTELAIHATGEGHLRIIDLHELAAAAHASAIDFMRLEVRIGDYVCERDLLLRVWISQDTDATQSCCERLRDAFQVDRDRTLQQDPSFGIRQIVDIAVKALSPGINDPTTAEQALDHLNGTLVSLMQRRIPSPLRTLDHGLLCLFRTPSFSDFVDESFGQIRRSARSNLHVTLYLARILSNLIQLATRPDREAVLRDQLDELLEGFDRSTLTERERQALDRYRPVLPGTTPNARRPRERAVAAARS